MQHEHSGGQHSGGQLTIAALILLTTLAQAQTCSIKAGWLW
jgi:hypothetical protein